MAWSLKPLSEVPSPVILIAARSSGHKGLETVDTTRVHPHDPDDDTVEAHYACLERPCCCLEGWVFVGYIDEYGEEREACYRCRRCAASPSR
jgi:hypothetical protein